VLAIREKRLDVTDRFDLERPIESIRQIIHDSVSSGDSALRLVFATESDGMALDLSILRGTQGRDVESLCNFRKRLYADTASFNVVMIIPTGIGAEIGGHAGDACPASRLLAEACDKLILHPNVVNASDLNEMPTNALYVEGSALTRLMMGTAGLAPVRSNRVLVVIDSHKDTVLVDWAINSINAARASAGIDIVEIVAIDPPVRLQAYHTQGGRATGHVDNVDAICRVLDDRIGTFDAVAFSSVIDVPVQYHADYFTAAGDMVNPWGGVEAMFTHAITSLYNLPSAHSPMFESDAIANLEVGVVDPRMAAEAISLTFLNCILKGLHQSPKLVTSAETVGRSGLFWAEQIAVLVQPDGCLGLPTLAALEQGIQVIAVRENRNIMGHDLTRLPWAAGQFWQVENYWEAGGLILALRAGIDPKTTRRPLGAILGGRMSQNDSERTMESEYKLRLG
jgi:hypothetical protein